VSNPALGASLKKPAIPVKKQGSYRQIKECLEPIVSQKIPEKSEEKEEPIASPDSKKEDPEDN